MRAWFRSLIAFRDSHHSSVRDQFRDLPHLAEPELAAKMTRRQKWDRPDPRKVVISVVYRVLSRRSA